MYKKIAAETDRQVRIKTHSLKRKTVPTTIFEENAKENEERNHVIANSMTRNKSETQKSYCILEQKEIKEKI